MAVLRTERILDINVSLGTQGEFVQALVEMVEDGQPHIVSNLNMNAAYYYYHDPLFKRLLKASDLVYLDSAPLAYWGGLMGRKVSPQHRHTAVDFFPPLFAELETRGLSVFFLGGREGDQRAIHHWVNRNFPHLAFGSRHGYFDLEDVRTQHSILSQLDRFGPSLLLVGMGMPRQERWVLENQSQLPACTTLCVGAVFDYFIGKIPTPPRAAGPLGVEWFYRWLAEPQRLTGRYFVKPLKLLPHLFRDLRSRSRDS